MISTDTCVSLLMTAALGLGGVVAPAKPPADCKVIANESIKAADLTPGELKDVLLTTRTTLDEGGHVAPVLLKSGGVQDTFVWRVTGKSAVALENYYRSLVFTGKGAMPKMLASDAAMVAYVRATKDTIGYVCGASPTQGVKVLEVKARAHP